MVGPLPNFATIEVTGENGSVVMFWWRRFADFYHVPRQQGKKRTFSEGPGSDGGGGGGDDDDSQSPQKSWKTILEDGLARHRQCKANQEQPQEKLYQHPHLKHLCNIEHEMAIYAIASVWDALRRDGTHFSYAGLDVFQGISLKKIGVVSAAADKFIMPLRFEHPTETMAHLLLVTADRVASTPQNTVVRLEIYDSCPGYIDTERIRRQCASLITGSHWHKNNGPASNPKLHVLTEPEISDIPKQEYPWSCGFHSIIAAWCIMLGIPIHNSNVRHTRLPRDVFLKYGLEIVNLAMCGCMDTQTIQAFLHYFGYAAKLEADGKGALIKPLSTQAMSASGLGDLLEQLAREERGVQPVSDADVDILMQYGQVKGNWSRNDAKAALIDYKGDVELTAQMLEIRKTYDATSEAAVAALAAAEGDVDIAAIDLQSAYEERVVAAQNEEATPLEKGEKVASPSPGTGRTKKSPSPGAGRGKAASPGSRQRAKTRSAGKVDTEFFARDKGGVEVSKVSQPSGKETTSKLPAGQAVALSRLRPRLRLRPYGTAPAGKK